MSSSSDSIGIDNTQGDVIAKVGGTGTIAGKDVHVTIEGNVINIGNALSSHIKEILEPSRVPKDDQTYIENSQRIQQAKASEKSVQEIMYILKRVEEKEGLSPSKIKAGNYDVSTEYILEKKHILEGNKYFFKGQYDKAIECYDKAIDIEPYNAEVWYNKGCALEEIKKNNEAMRCYDNAMNIEPQYPNAWYAKGKLLYQNTAKQKLIISMTFYVSISVLLFGTIIVKKYLELPTHVENSFLWITSDLIYAVFYITIPLLFLFFWYKEGITEYRRLDKSIKRIILRGGIVFIVFLCAFVILVNIDYETLSSIGISYYFMQMGRNITLPTIVITITFFLFLYNTTSKGEYYLNKAKELGKKDM
jgi:tetratricopeptide (TPR) repeat protein